MSEEDAFIHQSVLNGERRKRSQEKEVSEALEKKFFVVLQVPANLN
jgi:hypothetical protein